MNPIKNNIQTTAKTKIPCKKSAVFFTCVFLLLPEVVWAVACVDIFPNGIQTTLATGNINLSYHSAITGGTAVLKTATLTDSSAWAACSGATCAASGTPALKSTPAFVLGTSANGNISVPYRGSDTYSDGDYGTVSVAQEGILKFNTNSGVYKSKAFTTGLRSEVWLRSGDYWVDGNLSLGQETILRRISPSGTTRIFVKGNISLAYKVSTSNFDSDQLLLYATGTITSANEANLSAFIYGAGNVSFGYLSVINGAVSGNNFTASGNQVTVNYQPSSFNTGNFSPFCSGAAASVDHYELELAATSLACLGADVTVRACADNASPCALATDVGTNVTLGTSGGTLDQVTLTLASGVGTTRLKNAGATDGSTTTVTVSGEQTLAVNARKCCTSASNCSVANSCNITFNTAGFVFSNSNTAMGNIPTEIAGVTDSNVYVRALQTNTTTGACTARFTAPQNVPLAYQCRNPATCMSGQTLTLNGTAIQSNDSAAATITYTNVSLNFDGQGAVAIPVNYSDVGQIRLLASLPLGATTADPAYVLSGTSNDFVVKPYTLAVSSVVTAANGANPGGTSVAGTAAGFIPAGTAFHVRVESRRSPGTLSTHITPNFGRETTPENNNMKLAEVALIYPAGGTLTPLTGAAANSFTATIPTGTFINSTVAWDQVGSITMRPELTDNDYLGAGNISALTTSGTIGRFYPDRYTLSSSTVSNGCSSFSYMAQPNINLSYQIVAQSLNGITLTNYGGNYATAATIAAPTYVAENADGADGPSLSPRVSPGATPTWSSGVLPLASTVATFNRQTGNAVPDGPFASLQWGLDLTDSFDARSLQGKNMDATTSGVCTGVGCTAVSLGSPLVLRYGRVRLDDAFGPETVALPVNFVTEYWTGNYFALHTNDSCTVIPRAAITYPNGTLLVDANRTVSLSSGTTQGIYNNIDATGVNFNAGTAAHYFSKPSSGGTGSFTVGVDLASLTWLRYDWNQDGNYSDVAIPNARFSFGSYRGHDRIIYWREKLQ